MSFKLIWAALTALLVLFTSPVWAGGRCSPAEQGKEQDCLEVELRPAPAPPPAVVPTPATAETVPPGVISSVPPPVGGGFFPPRQVLVPVLPAAKASGSIYELSPGYARYTFVEANYINNACLSLYNPGLLVIVPASPIHTTRH